jgi:hypothetical protein
MEKEAFVYCWTDHKKEMLYVGVHKGTVDDGYVCSSKIMMEEYKKRPEDFTRQIVASGTYKDMYKFETKILRTEDVVNNPHYYNINMNNGFYKNKGFPLTEEHKQNIKIAASKKPHPMLGEKHSDKARQKMSISRKKFMLENNITMSGEDHPMYGRKQSKEHTKKIGDALRGKKRPEEVLEKVGHGRSGVYKITKPDSETVVIKNLAKFCKENNLHISNMFNRGKSKGYCCENLHMKEIENANQ